MSRLTRTLITGAMLAVMNLAGLTAVAQAESSDRPASNQDSRRPPTLPTATEDPHGQLAHRKALYQSELDTILARHHALGALGVLGPVAQRQALYQSELEHDLATAPAADRAATRPIASTDPAVPGPGVDVLATLLVGLVGGLVGGALVVISVVVTRAGRLRVRGAA
jgi:hypothetical protein